MIVADTSIWIDHFRVTVADLPRLILQGKIRMHPFVLGELALGSVPDRTRLFAILAALPSCDWPDEQGLLAFSEGHAMPGKGIGFVDLCLLKSCHDNGDQLWTSDKRLLAQAQRLGIAFQP